MAPIASRGRCERRPRGERWYDKKSDARPLAVLNSNYWLPRSPFVRFSPGHLDFSPSSRTSSRPRGSNRLPHDPLLRSFPPWSLLCVDRRPLSLCPRFRPTHPPHPTSSLPPPLWEWSGRWAPSREGPKKLRKKIQFRCHGDRRALTLIKIPQQCICVSLHVHLHPHI